MSGKFLQRIVHALLLSASLMAGAAAGGFAPVPVNAIYPPLKGNGSADDALATGHVVDENYSMAAHARKPWRIAFLFPHIKDTYWAGCSYGVISEARRLGVAVDIFPADGYDDLVGQLRMMDEAIAAKYDAIVISPISQTANNSSIARARAGGVPVFELANDSTSDDLTVRVTSSLKGVGVKAMQWIIIDAQKRGLKSVNIALLPGPSDAGRAKGEVAGTYEAAHNAPISVNIVAVKYGDSDLIAQSQLAAQLLGKYGRKLDYILACTICAPAAVLPVKMAGLSGKVRIVAYDLTREIAGFIHKGDIVAAVDSKGVSQARIAIDAAVNFLEGRNEALPHTILVKLGLLDKGNYAGYAFDGSIAPRGYEPVLSYDPGRK